MQQSEWRQFPCQNLFVYFDNLLEVVDLVVVVEVHKSKFGEL